MSKALIIPALVFASLFSCHSDDDKPAIQKFDVGKYPQKWTLVEMSGSIPNIAPATGNDMSWQEYYVFSGDKTFIKVHDKDGVKSQADGTYDSLTTNEQRYLHLIFNSGKELVETCGHESEETLYFLSDTELASSWQLCDGPGLTYKRLE